MEQSVSVIIATAGSPNRLESLRGLLEGLHQQFSREEIDHEIIVANNATGEPAACEVEKLVDEFRQAGAKRFLHIRESSPGKCRAQNAAIAKAKGSILAFLDDDVEVTPGWLGATAKFFNRDSFAAMQGPILIPSALQSNEEFLRLNRRYKTINFVEEPPRKGKQRLIGANIAIRAEVFSRIGFFNESLGPGKSGMSEDAEFAERIIRSGGRIGYEPQAAVYHRADWSRLTEEYFRLRHEQQGRSRLIYKDQSIVTILPNFARSVLTFAWYSLLNNERKKYRAKGRYFHYRAMLLEKFKTFKPFNPP